MSPIDFPLEGDKLRSFLLHDGWKLLTAFDSGAATLDFLRDNGMKIRTQDFYEIRRAVLNMQSQSDVLPSVPGNELVPLAEHVTIHGWDLSQNFLYRFRVDGVDPKTELAVTKYFAISSNKQLSPNEAADILGGMIVGEEEFYEVRAEHIELVGALARPGLW